MPTTEELYEEATRVSDDQIEKHEASDGWGGGRHQETLSNFFVWDLEPDRFYNDDNVPEEIVVLPNVYGGFVDGTGFSLVTPLNDSQDKRDAEQVLGEENLEEFDDGVPCVVDVDTPQDVMEMHYLANNMDIDVYRLSAFDDFLGDWTEDDPKYQEWAELADRGLENFVKEYTEPVQERFVPEAIEKFADNGNRTAFVMYADNCNETYPEETIYKINDAAQGDLAYHTPTTVNHVLKNDLME